MQKKVRFIIEMDISVYGAKPEKNSAAAAALFLTYTNEREC